MTLSSSTFVPGFDLEISTIWTSWLHQPSDIIFFEVRSSELAISNGTEFSHCWNLRRQVIYFLASLPRHIYPGRVITLRAGALRVIAFGLHPKIRELYPSRRFLHTQNNDPGKLFPMHQAAFLTYSWCRVIISIIFNSGSLPTQFWAQIRIPRLFFILNNGSRSI